VKHHHFIISALAAGLAVLACSCSSDPEGPVSGPFVDDGTFGVRAGETRRIVLPVEASVVAVPLGIGKSALLWLGGYRGIEYRAILLKFDFTLDEEDAGKTILSASLYLPMKAASDTLLSISATFNELTGDFTDADTITAVPPFEPDPIGDGSGGTLRDVTIANTEYDLDTTIVSQWISGARVHHGIAIIPWSQTPAGENYLEMYAHERGKDPPRVVVTFTDSTEAVFASEDDYTITDFNADGLNCVGGIARRVNFTFATDSIPARAIVQGSFLVVKVIGENGFGATLWENNSDIGYSSSFYYYLYAPDSADPDSADFQKGTGVDTGVFDPVESKTIRMSLRGYLFDILSGVRPNHGVVLQSNLESSRIQRVSLSEETADKAYIEVIYSLPAEFRGDR